MEVLMGRSERFIDSLPDDKVAELGDVYSKLCAMRRRGVMMSGFNLDSFEQFVASRVHAEQKAQAVLLNKLKEARSIPPRVEFLPMI
jgi:hypothetical protein